MISNLDSIQHIHSTKENIKYFYSENKNIKDLQDLKSEEYQMLKEEEKILGQLSKEQQEAYLKSYLHNAFNCREIEMLMN
jgi:hypothetical protein